MSATPANSQAALEAERNGKPFHKLISTTPGDLKTAHGIWAKKFIGNSAQFDESLYSKDKDEIAKYIEVNSTNNFVFIQFSYKQLGRSEAWFKKQCRDLNNDQLKIRREILLEWCKSSDVSPFTSEEIERLYTGIRDPIATLMVKKYYPLLIYKDFDWHGRLLIGIDSAGGYSKDSSAITVADADTLEVVADFNNNSIDTVELAELIVEMATKYFPNCVIIPERNNIGKGVIDILLKTPVARKLYFEVKKTQAEKRIEDVKKQSMQKTVTRVYGVNTDNKTRPQMIDLIRTVINEDHDKINSRRIVDDIAGLERKNTGKIEHGDTSHDDNLFSYLMIRWVWAFGTNLSHFFIYKKRAVQSLEEGEPQEDGTNEFVRQFTSVASFNRNEHRTRTPSQELIEEYYRVQNERRERDAFEATYSGSGDPTNEFFKKIVGFNSM